MILSRLRYKLGEYEGVTTVLSTYKNERAQKALLKRTYNYFQLAGLSISLDDIKIISFDTPNETVETDNVIEFNFVCFKSGKGNGPWHMLAGASESGGLACGANRRMSSKTGQLNQQQFPDGKSCQKCRHIWKKKIKDTAG